MESCRECCYAALTGANLYCSINDCYVGELSCDDFEPIVKAKTNADRIRAMTDEEMAGFFDNMAVCDTCPLFDKMKPCPLGCKATWESWLKQEAGE